MDDFCTGYSSLAAAAIGSSCYLASTPRTWLIIPGYARHSELQCVTSPEILEYSYVQASPANVQAPPLFFGPRFDCESEA